MKRIIYILILLLIGFTAIAQETPPAGLKAINAQFYIHFPDSTIWQQKGSPYGWHQVPKQKSIKHYIDSIAGLGGLYKLKTDSVNNSGYVTHGFLKSFNGTTIQHYADSLYARTVNLFNSQTIYGSKLFKSPITITDTTNGTALTVNGNGTALTVNGFAQFNSNIGFVGNLTWDAITTFHGLQFYKSGDPVNYYQLVFDPATLKFGSAYDNANFKPFATQHYVDSLIALITPASIIYTSGTGTANTFTNSSLQNVFIDGVWRDGIEYLVISGTPVGNQVTVNTTTGAVVFQDNINTSEYIKVRYRGISGTSSGGGNPQLITVNSYSEMASQLSGSAYKVFYVKADEINGGGNPTEYLFYNGILIRNVPQQAN